MSDDDLIILDGHTFQWKKGDSILECKVENGLFHASTGEVYRVKNKAGLDLNARWLPAVRGDVVKEFWRVNVCKSRHIVRVFDGGKQGEGLAILTEPFDPTLRQVLQGQPLPLEQAYGYASQILSALVELESVSLIPLVVSPDSVGCWADAVALDEYFLGFVLPENSRIPLDRLGYLPPDLNVRQLKKSDPLWGLGATLFEMLTGTPLIQGSGLDVVAQASRGDFVSRWPDFPVEIRDFLLRLVQPAAAERFSGAAEAYKHWQSLAGRIEAGAVFALPTGVTPGDKAGPLPAGPRLVLQERNEQGFAVFLREPDGARMVLLPGGSFRMGDGGKAPASPPGVEVHLEPFLIDEQPVTWSLFVRLLDRAGAKAPKSLVAEKVLPPCCDGKLDDMSCWSAAGPFGPPMKETNKQKRREMMLALITENHPAVLVSQVEASRLGEVLGLELPSEAEWEYACRGGTTTLFWWGNEPDDKRAWYAENSENQPQAIGVLGDKAVNPFGLIEMAGNVAEFCRDYFHPDALGRAAGLVPGRPLTPEQLAEGITEKTSKRSARNGSWDNTQERLCSAARFGVEENATSLMHGFRYVIRKSHAPDWAIPAFESLG